MLQKSNTLSTHHYEVKKILSHGYVKENTCVVLTIAYCLKESLKHCISVQVHEVMIQNEG